MLVGQKSNTIINGRPSCSLDMLKARALQLSRARVFFASRDVLEVVTPALSSAATTEPMLDSFAVTPPASLSTGEAASGYLCTSPELMLKRLLCAGSGPIYQIAPVYRAGEVGRLHNPEFLMLEWYRPGYKVNDLMQEVEDFMRAMLLEAANDWPTVYYSYVDLFLDVTGVDPLLATAEVLQELALSKGVIQKEDRLNLSTDEWLDLLMSTVIEPSIKREQITFVHSYPASQAALARLSPDDPRVAERFEVYLMGMELANGFRELTDGAQQTQRFKEEVELRRQMGKECVPPDQRFLAAIASGLPESSGVSVGLDRLLMVQTGAKCIADVLSFAWNNV